MHFCMTLLLQDEDLIDKPRYYKYNEIDGTGNYSKNYSNRNKTTP
jgi:hypothetical protein